MNKFEKQLEKWNKGILRGAQAKLAKKLGVSTATTALWATGKRRPSKGYASQMAELFKMDIYNVFKLFENKTTTYPTPTRSAQLLLREKSDDCSYTSEEENMAQSNSVRLPFFSQIPTQFPNYNEDDVLEWWSVPRRYACGAKYIVPSLSIGLDTADSEDLCFLKPCSDVTAGEKALYKLQNGQYTCQKPQQTEEAAIVASIVRRIATPK